MASTGRIVWVGRGISAMVALPFLMSAFFKLKGGPEVAEGFAHLGVARVHSRAPRRPRALVPPGLSHPGDVGHRGDSSHRVRGRRDLHPLARRRSVLRSDRARSPRLARALPSRESSLGARAASNALSSPPSRYSCLRSDSGSTRAARRAGTVVAERLTVARRTVVPRSVGRSNGATP